MPVILKNKWQDIDGSSNASSISSLWSNNDACSVSSIDLSFDGSGMPYIKTNKQSAFSRVHKKSQGSLSNPDEDKDYITYEEEKGLGNLGDDNDSSQDINKKVNKSSFFRLKNSKSYREDENG